MRTFSNYVVTYRNRRSDQCQKQEFYTKAEALKFARQFVANGFPNEASAVVDKPITPDNRAGLNICRYDNHDGKAVRS